jgi:NAD(P)-dependent dehydrogenase (short-subunit alcohol dehydrogenase family)
MTTDGHAPRLAGKRALITGASSGIGAATARAFAAEGARVALLARRPEPLERLADELGDGARSFPADVADAGQVERAVAEAADWLSGLDVVVNSAGIAVPVSLTDLTEERWREVIDINLSGSFYVARAAGLRMVRAEGGGTIINLGSELSVLGMGMYVAYCASKAGVIGLTKALAAELAPEVTVNAVCPGPVDTPMLDSEFKTFPDPKAAYDATLERVLLHRLATPQEVALAILYLAADAPYATGTTLELDGGTTVV